MRDKNSVVTILTGSAGDHYVAYRLSVMGYLVAVTRTHWPMASMMVGHMAGHAAVTLEVTTSHGAYRGYGGSRSAENRWSWHMETPDYMPNSTSFCYAFVDLKYPSPFDPPEQVPDVFIVPAKDVIEQLADRRTSPFGEFVIKEPEKSKYFEAWHHITDHIEPRPTIL